MSAMSLSMPRTGKFPTGLFAFTILVIIIVMLVIPALNEHAVAKHAEATAIHKCLENQGPAMTFWQKAFGSFYLACEFEPGRWGLQICTASGVCKSAFSPRDGSWRSVKSYLDNIHATPFKGLLPWSQ